MVSIGTVSTEHFAFMAIGRDPEHATALIMQAWNLHADVFGARLDYLTSARVHVITGEIGEVFRDGGRIIDATTPDPEPTALVWLDAGNDDPGDQNADSRRIDEGCTSMFWSLGRTHDKRWSVELIGVSHGEPQPLAGLSLGAFNTEVDAKASAQHIENKAAPAMSEDIYPRNLEDGLAGDIQKTVQLMYGTVLKNCGILSGDISPGASLRLEAAEAEMIGAITGWILEGMDEDHIYAAQQRMDGQTSASVAIKATQPDDTTSA